MSEFSSFANQSVKLLAQFKRGARTIFRAKPIDTELDTSALEVREPTPKLRRLAVIGIAAMAGLIMACLSFSLTYLDLTKKVNTELIDAQKVLTSSLDSIDRDLSLFAHESKELSCDAALQNQLMKAAFSSNLVNQFYVQEVSASTTTACGVFGATHSFWSFDPTQQGIQIVPSENIHSNIVVGQLKVDSLGKTVASVALINPQRLIVPLPKNSTQNLISLKSIQGKTLASNHLSQDSNHFITGEPITHRVSDWPVVLQGRFSPDAMLTALRGQIVQWLLSTMGLTLAAVVFINRKIASKSSRSQQLEHALRKRRFAPVVQPIVRASDGQCIGVEILMRWKHPNRGLVPPAEFIDYAERSGLIVPMSDLLMRQAHRQLTEIALTHPHLYFSFNITPSQLRVPSFSKTLLEIFDGDPIGPSRVLLELTERDLVDQHTRDELMRLTSFGFKIAIDDFGTGQSSLAVLQNLSFDKLKIDRAFVNTISDTEGGQPVLDAIIGLAHTLKIDMVAEGIETEQQQQYLCAKGVQALQGYRFSRPLTPLDFSTWLTKAQTAAQAKHAPQDPLAQILVELQAARPELEQNRWYRGKRYRQCLLGNELVSWLANQYKINRPEALKLGQRLLAKGFVVHVIEEHDLKDAPYFYRLLSQQAIDESHNSRSTSVATNAQLIAWLNGLDGITPGNRHSGFLTFSLTVRGSEVVEALSKAGQLTRAQAVAAGVQLMRAGLLKHVFDKNGFSDSLNQFYHVSLH